MNCLTLERARVLEGIPGLGSRFVGSWGRDDIYVQCHCGDSDDAYDAVIMYDSRAGISRVVWELPAGSDVVFNEGQMLAWSGGSLYYKELRENDGFSENKRARPLVTGEASVVGAGIAGENVVLAEADGTLRFLNMQGEETQEKISLLLGEQKVDIAGVSFRANAFGTQIVLAARAQKCTVLATLDRVGSFDPTHPRDLVLQKERQQQNGAPQGFALPPEGHFVLTCIRSHDARLELLGYQREGCVILRRLRNAAGAKAFKNALNTFTDSS